MIKDKVLIVDDSYLEVQVIKDMLEENYEVYYSMSGEGIEDIIETSYTASIVGKLKNGKFPLTAEEIALLDEVYNYQNPGETTGDYDNIKTSE